MKTKHTPGPWYCVDTSNHAHDYRLLAANGVPLPLNVVANDHSEQRANARLIAAAPDLLAALRGMVCLYEFMHARNPHTDSRPLQALAAIAKAEGSK